MLLATCYSPYHHVKNDHLRKKALNISQLSFLVLDEADEMLDLGFREDLDAIIQSSPNNTRKLLFSATLPKKIILLANKYLVNPKKIEVLFDPKSNVVLVQAQLGRGN